MTLPHTAGLVNDMQCSLMIPHHWTEFHEIFLIYSTLTDFQVDLFKVPRLHDFGLMEVLWLLTLLNNNKFAQLQKEKKCVPIKYDENWGKITRCEEADSK